MSRPVRILSRPPERAAVAKLLRAAGVTGAFTLHPLPGGANNRPYRVRTARGDWFLKAYFRHPADPRDRLQAEFAFSRFAWERDIRCLPQPVAADRERGLGLYAFIEGVAIPPEQVTGAHVRLALDFYHALNRHRYERAALALPPAAESWFTLGEHLTCVERRVARLAHMTRRSPVDRRAEAFVQADLLPAWRRIRTETRVRAADWGLNLDEPLAQVDRCLSPSDFGFHNALVDREGRLWFLDFEYAGWDDPAKAVSDFFLQPQTPAPRLYEAAFIESVADALSHANRFFRRVRILRPVYTVKWCCILLNDFLAEGAQRRSFARGPRSSQERKAVQLAKAAALIQTLTEEPSGILGKGRW